MSPMFAAAKRLADSAQLHEYMPHVNAGAAGLNWADGVATMTRAWQTKRPIFSPR
jgi:hypothetical protein